MTFVTDQHVQATIYIDRIGMRVVGVDLDVKK